MDSELCNAKTCSLEAKFECRCKRPYQKFCDNHILSHMNDEPIQSHSTFPIFDHFFGNRSKIKELEEALIIFRETKQKLIDKILREYEQEVSKIKAVFTEKLVNVSKSMNYLLQRLELAIINRQDLFYSDELVSEILGVGKSRQKKKFDKILLRNVDTWTQKLLFKGEKFTYTCAENSKELIEINNKHLTQKRIKIDSLPEKLGRVPGICRFEDGDIFYCGGIPTGNIVNCVSSCYRINPRSLEFEKLPNMPGTACVISPTRVNDHIYVFGGRDISGCEICSAWKYSIRNKSWECLPNMPFSSQNVSCISANSSILLTGYFTGGIHEFNSIDYNKIFHSANGYVYLMRSFCGKLIFLSGGVIYESSEEDYRNWRTVGYYNASLLKWYIESTPQEYKNYFTMVINYKQYVRFNHETLTLEVLSFN